MKHQNATVTKATKTVGERATSDTQVVRRSHLNRFAGDRSFRISDNDVTDIFEPLSRYAQLTTRQLVAFGRRNQMITRQRLGELWHGTGGTSSHYLHRLNEDVLFANHLYVEDMHRLGREGEAVLISKSMIPLDDWALRTKIGGSSTAPSRIIRLAHDHMACNLVLDIEIGARVTKGAFGSHLDLLRNAPTSTQCLVRPLRIPVKVNGHQTFVEPDALFSIGHQVIALEADKGTETVMTTIRDKILAYREIVADCIIDRHLGIKELKVLIATTSEKRMHHMMAELAKVASNGKSKMFGFRWDDGFADFLQRPAPTGSLFSAPWMRVGHPPLILRDII